MAAGSLDVFILGFSDPQQPSSAQERDRIRGPRAFRLSTDNVRTLSTNTVNQASDVEGLLYVPDLDPADPCIDASSQYVPDNVTRQADLPPLENYQRTAFAPWVSATCVNSYLNAVPPRQASAFLFYDPLQATTDTPPPVNDQFWNLNDGGQWKKRNKLPVYAIPGPNGAAIMQALSQYSGDLSQVPNTGPQIQQFDPDDYIRLFANFNPDANSNLPTLWAFLLIVLAVVLILVGITSLSMHMVQRRHRRALQRRVESGEVTLEMLGIKKPRLTQADIDAIPLTTYTVDTEKKPPLPLPAEPPTSTITPSEPPVSPKPTDPSPLNYSQPTCPICLEDYIPSTTRVRSLPCNHIFHPDCIDRYLLTTSQLCPICKTNLKPSAAVTFTGAPGMTPCPPITNAMVRRERYARRVRERPNDADAQGMARWASFRRQFRPPLGGGRRHTPVAATRITVRERSRDQRERGSAVNSGVEMQDVSTQTHAPTVEERPRDPEGRREWARRRASAMLGRNHPGAVGVVGGDAVAVGDAEEGRTGAQAHERRGGALRRGVGRVFPGFG